MIMLRRLPCLVGAVLLEGHLHRRGSGTALVTALPQPVDDGLPGTVWRKVYAQLASQGVQRGVVDPWHLHNYVFNLARAVRRHEVLELKDDTSPTNLGGHLMSNVMIRLHVDPFS